MLFQLKRADLRSAQDRGFINGSPGALYHVQCTARSQREKVQSVQPYIFISVVS